MDDAGLAAVVGMEMKCRVSGESPAMEACDILPLKGVGTPCAFGVADLRPVLP